MNKILRLLAVFMSVAFITTGGADAGKKLTIQGSDTLLEMVTAEAAAYMSQNKGAIIQVTGGGSGVGIAAIINGSTDIADASRPMKKKERKRIEKNGAKVFEVAIALDGVSLYMHPDNPVSDLSTAQLKDIYTGKINNWKEVGGNDAKIIRYSRENSSGTYAFFKKHVLKKQNYAADCQNMPGTASVVNAVSKDKNAIGYGGLSYAEGVKVVKVNGILPSPETVSDGSYPVSRSLYQYTIGKPKGLAKKFIDFELSKDGQKLAIKAGYVPLPEPVRLNSLASL
ncbi:Phosphate ABC transporter, periplasmic phosphate-binding protein PstS (TC 3.A.1.7.1) [hydrothermal vent metagenome]|uniref:Phosphate ABC transporter, periplasmic phosphate-binding protein PstS (TC 3.A.1.7.1) n=1 Tax=hydrothermal vent metagenome TaxID=652676 RepID=A0A3B1BYZ4_9ZZZZ